MGFGLLASMKARASSMTTVLGTPWPLPLRFTGLQDELPFGVFRIHFNKYEVNRPSGV